jgi:hypothetical protein
MAGQPVFPTRKLQFFSIFSSWVLGRGKMEAENAATSGSLVEPDFGAAAPV